MEAAAGRLFWPAAGADRVAAAFRLLDEAGEIPGEVADLLLPEDQALDVLRVAGQIVPVDVDDREVRVRELLRDLRDRVRLVEADRDDEVGALARRGREARDVIRGRGRLVDRTLDPELLLGLLQARVGELVEPVVVELADVGDEDDRGLVAAGGGRARVAAAAARPAAACREERHGDGDGEESKSARVHVVEYAHRAVSGSAPGVASGRPQCRRPGDPPRRARL